MIKDALRYLVGLGQTEIIEIDGFKYATNQCEKIYEPVVSRSLKTSTLEGVIDYINENVDTHEVGEGFTIHIESPTKVSVLSSLNKDRIREVVLESNAIIPRIRFDSFYDSEMFNIELLSNFIETDELNSIVKVAGTIVEGEEQTTTDDGMTQKVVAKTGIARVGEIEIKNPFELTPIRTFNEVNQPASYFIFRVRKGPQCALFECGDTSWRNEAMCNIKCYLKEHLNREDITIIM